MLQSLIAKALLSNPLLTSSQLTGANFQALKRKRVEVVIRKSENLLLSLSKQMSTTQLKEDYPLLIQRVAEHKAILSRLDYKELIALSTIDDLYRKVKDKESLAKYLGCDFPKRQQDEKHPVYVNAERRGASFRAESLSFRIQEELSLGGYPVFWTLTADPVHEGIFDPRRDEFRLFLRTVRRKFGDFRYCGVTERGEEGKIHVHCLFIFSECRFSDPNEFRPKGKLQCPTELRRFWPYGWSDPVAVRFQPMDAYGQLGWRWPVELKTGSPEAVAVYMSKYVRVDSKEVKGCRTKMTRNFGLFRVNQMTLSQALMILSGTKKIELNFIAKPPLRLLKSRAARIVFGQESLAHLPETKSGSVQGAVATFNQRKFSPLNAGDSINPVGHSNCILNEYKKEARPLQTGAG